MKLLAYLLAISLCLSCKSTKVNEQANAENLPPKQLNENPEVIPPRDDNSNIKALKNLNTTQDSLKTTENKPIEIEVTSLNFNHNNFNELLKKHVDEKGNVNYKGFKTDWKSLKQYINQLAQNTPQSTWSKNEILAYWINAYNALTIDLILRHYPVKSIKDIKDPWKQRFWKLNQKWYNLDEIEHQILRKMNEPRIHFAIVCASVSCPKLLNKAYSANNLDEDLTLTTKAFLNDASKNEISSQHIKLSKIFKWFAKDFKTEGSLIDFLNRYSDIKISANAKKSFKDYNWNLNE